MVKICGFMQQTLGCLAIAVALAGCADTGTHSAHHPGEADSAAHGGGMMGNGMMGGGMMGGGMMGSPGAGPSAAPPAQMPMDREAMCEQYHQIQSAPTEQQRQAIIEQHMRGMSAEMRQHHLDMMRQQCGHQ